MAKKFWEMRKDSIIIGMALFAVFFGAGNLIFPPKLGILSGSQWLQAVAGFFTTDIGLSILAIFAVVKAGGSFINFGNKVGKKFSLGMGVSLMLSLGPLICIPRTGAVSYELGFTPIFGDFSQYAFTFVYFGAALFFVLNPKSIIDKIGKWLTPVLIISIGSIIIKNIINPIGEIGTPSIDNIYTYAFLQGYQTLDGIAAVLFASIVILTLKQKGYTDHKTQVKMTIYSCIVAFSLIGFVYGGLIYLGATGNMIIDHNLSLTESFVALVNHSFGETGIWIISITVLFACFSTTTGLTATIAEYFTEASNNKLSYKFNVIAIIVVSYIISNLGVSYIVKFAGPILSIVSPAILVLIVINLIDKGNISKNIYRGAVGGSIVFTCLFYIGDFVTSIKEALYYLPLAKYEMGWVLPSLIGGLLYAFTIKYYRKVIN